MAYTINKTNGSVLATIADGTIDNTTDLTLIGKNYSGYGELLNENLVKLLENFANSSAPANKLAGQLWWDTTNGLLKVYNGSTFKVISGSTASASAPTGSTTGDLWWDTANTQLKVYSGATWVTVGPSFTAGTGTSGAIVDTIVDNIGSSHVIVKLFVQNSIVGVVSKDSAFTPQTPLTGFATINPGIQLSTSVSGSRFRGTATDALLLDGIAKTQFVRSDTNSSISGSFSVLNDAGGLSVGADQDLRLTISGTDTYITNATSDGDMFIRVTPSSGGGAINAFTIDGATGVVTLPTTPAANNSSERIATTRYVDDNTLYRNGTKTITGNLVPDGNNTRSLGAIGTRFNTVFATTFYGVANGALYADLAERFAADDAYEPGTIVALGGAAEITKVNEELSEEVFGVISDKPAYLMHCEYGPNETHPPVAMAGRVPVKVKGKVRKGDRLVSAGDGMARAAKKGEANTFNTFGRALEDKLDDANGIVTAVVTIN